MSDAGKDAFYFEYSATLRIFGNIPDLSEITRQLGVEPTSTHRKGERGWGPNLPAFEHDMWSYTAPVEKSENLHVHIDALCETFKTRKDYLLQLKQNATVDISCGYRSNCDHAGIEVPWQSLEIFRELQLPFGVSIIVA
jgi:hypothetical protein